MDDIQVNGRLSESDSDSSDSSDTMWTRNLMLETCKLKIEEDYHAGM